MTAVLTVMGLVLDSVFGEPRRWHPLVGFGRWARYLESRLNNQVPHVGLLRLRWHAPVPDGLSVGAAQRSPPRGAASPGAQRLLGILALLVAVAPGMLLAAATRSVPVLNVIVDVATLYFAVGYRSLREHALRVHEALESGDLGAARTRVGLMVSRDTHNMNDQSVAVAAVESVLENGNDAVFGALFWFLLAGAPGALLYRLVNTLDAMWGYRTPRYLYFGWAAARLDDVLNYVPARLTALSYALTGCTGSALRCWREQAGAWESPNAGPVMAAGAGALRLALGGGAYYHGRWEERPALGIGPVPDARAIPAALRLIRTSVLLWVLVIVITELVIHA